MTNFICNRCGVEYGSSESPPPRCLICEDGREAVAFEGQRWTTMEELRASGYVNVLQEEDPGLIGIGTQPRFAIGQRAILVQAPGGNVLYDCISLLEEETTEAVKALGGIQAICLSHPHFYDSMVTWSHTFGDAPIYIPEADRAHVTRPDPVIRYWDGAPLELVPGVTLIQCGGHFEGSAVLHWASGANGKGALLTGDTITVVEDRRYVSFMRSYPNLIPLSVLQIRQIVAAVEPFAFDRIYGGWWDRNILREAKEAVRVSAKRYIEHVGAMNR